MMFRILSNMKVGKMAAALTLLFLTSMTFADAPQYFPPSGGCQFGYYPSGGGCRPDIIINAATIVMFIVALFLAAMYMIAKTVGSPRLINWTEEELYQAVGTAVILMFYLSSLSILDNVVGPAFSGSSIAYPGEVRSAGNFATVKQMASSYIDSLIGQVSEIIGYLAKTGLFVGMLGTLTLIVSISGQQQFLPLLPGFGALMSVISTILSLLVPFAMQLHLQKAILNSWDGLFGVLLPLGILLRAFPFTRVAGGALIAVAVGFTIFLPLVYLLVQDVATHYWNTYCGNIDLKISVIPLDFGIVTGSFSAVTKVVENLFETGPGGVMHCVIFKLGIEASILPFFGFLMVLNITRYIAELLGANVDFSALVRLI